MNGLDAILESILSEARGKADVLLSEARERAADIRAQGEREAAALLLQMEEAAAGEADAVRARAESSSAMAGRRILLDARRRTVTGLVDQAMASLSELPAEEKVRLYAGFLRQARGGETVVFGAADLASGVAARAVAEAERVRSEAGEPALGLTVAEEPGRFLGGLVLRRGLIEDNLTFEMLTRQSRESLEAYAAGLLEK